MVLKSTRATNVLLAEIEKESNYYNMNLKQNKCEVIAMNRDNNIKFSDGTPLEHVNQAVYLGGTLTKYVNPLTEKPNLIAGCIPVLRKLNIFLKNINSPLKWKLNVFNAAIVTKWVYGLETVQFTDNAGN